MLPYDCYLKTLIDSSAERDNEFTNYLKSQKLVAVAHVQCWKNYTRRNFIAAMKRQHEENQARTSRISTIYIRTIAHIGEED